VAELKDVELAVRNAEVAELKDVELAVRNAEVAELKDVDDDKLPQILFFQLSDFRILFDMITLVLQVSKNNVSKFEFRNIINLYS